MISNYSTATARPASLLFAELLAPRGSNKKAWRNVQILFQVWGRHSCRESGNEGLFVLGCYMGVRKTDKARLPVKSILAYAVTGANVLATAQAVKSLRNQCSLRGSPGNGALFDAPLGFIHNPFYRLRPGHISILKALEASKEGCKQD